MTELKQAAAVVGGGPVGSILSAYLVRAGHETYVVESSVDRCDQIHTDGLVLTGLAELRARPHVVLKTVEELAEYKERLRICFLCTKTWALRTVLPALQKALRPDTLVVSFQNGIGPEDDIARYFPRDRVGRVVVNLGCGIKRDGRVSLQWVNPPSFIGAIDGTGTAMEEFASLLTRIGLETEFVATHEVRKKVFWKTILNSALNALCASSGITMKQAMELKHTRALAGMLVSEGLSVGSAVGYNYGEDAKEQCIRYLDAGGDHLPSMWIDLERRNPTEIEYMNGKIVKIGRMFKNIDVDVNMFFTSMIVTLEIKSGARAPTDVPDYLVH